MTVDFDILKRNELRAAVELEAVVQLNAPDYKKPSAQGIGIGKEFITYIEDFIRTQGGRELVLFTNSDKNIAYYKRCGFF